MTWVKSLAVVCLSFLLAFPAIHTASLNVPDDHALLSISDISQQLPARLQDSGPGPFCYPNVPLNRVDYWDDLFATRQPGNGWLSATQTASQEIEVDRKRNAVYRDMLTQSVRAVHMYGNPATGLSGCGADGQWFSMGSALALWTIQIEDSLYDVWVTSDHIIHQMDYSNRRIRLNHVKVDQADGIILPRHPEYRLGAIITPHQEGVSAFGDRWLNWGEGRSMEDLVYNQEDLYVGQTVYTAYTTLGRSCLPRSNSELPDCLMQYPMVNAGPVTSVLDHDGRAGASYNAQVDVMGGASGSPDFVFVDNGDDVINFHDFQLVGITNIGWASGVEGAQKITAQDIRQIRSSVKSLLDTWETQTDSTEIE